MKNVYSINFNDETSSDSYGASFTNKREAIAEARLLLNNKGSYLKDYIGGTIDVYNETTNEVVWSQEIKK